MKTDFELIQEYEDISTTNRPKIAPYRGDMFIDVEMEYLMRKKLEERISYALDYIELHQDKEGELVCSIDKGKTCAEELKEILKGSE